MSQCRRGVEVGQNGAGGKYILIASVESTIRQRNVVRRHIACTRVPIYTISYADFSLIPPRCTTRRKDGIVGIVRPVEDDTCSVSKFMEILRVFDVSNVRLT